MNDDLGKIWFGMGLDNAALEKDALKSKAIIKGIGQTTAETGARMENSFSSVGKGLAMIGGTAAIMMLGKQILDVTAKFEKFGIVLRNTLGEAKGTAALDMIANFAATTPFQLDEVTGAFIKMANQGFVPTQAEMIKLGDLASSTGKGFDQLAEAVLDAQTGEFERLKEFGIKASQNGDKVTFSFKEQKTTVENTNSAIQAYILSLGTLKGVAGANALISASLTGQISNLQDKLSMMFNNIGKANKGLLYDAVGGASSLIDNYETVGEAVKALIAVYGAYKLAVMYVNYEQKIAAAANLLVAESNGFLVASEARVIVMKERSIATQKAFNASVLANPYVLAAMAITALGFALYKVITYQTDLEKAIGKTNLQIENEKDKSSQLFAELNNAAKDTDEWRNAKQRIIDQYGTYLTAQQQEALGLGNIKEARDAVNRGIESTIALKMKEETLTGVSNKFNPTITDESQRIISKVKDKAGADKAYEMQFKLADFVEKSKSGKSTEEEAKALKVELMSLVGGVDGVGHATSMASQNMAAFFNRVTSAISDQKNEIKSVTEAYDKYNIIAKKAAPEAAAPILTTYAAQKKALEDQKKKLEAELAKAKVTPGEDPTKKVVEIQGKIDAINKQLGTKKTNADDKNYELQLKKEQSDLQRAQVDLEQSITKAKIEAMNDGLDKTLAQNQFNYEKEIEQIKRQKEDALTKLHEQEKTLWESKGGKGKFTPTISSLTPEDSAKYDTLSQQARQAKTAADQKASEDALKQYQTYAEKRIDIIKKYNKDTQDVLAAGGTIENVKEVEKEMNEALANLDMSQDKKTSIITRMFADMSNKSVKEINKLVDQTTEFINFLTNPEGYNAADGSFFKVTEEEYKKLTSDPEKMKAFIDQLKKLKEESLNVTPALGALAESWKELADSFKNSENNPGDFAQKLAALQAVVSKITAGVDLLSGAFTNLGESTGSDTLKNIGSTLKDISDVAGKTMSGAMTGAAVGGPIGAAVGAAVGLISSVAGIFSKASAEREKLKAQIAADQQAEFFGEIQINEEWRKRYDWAKKIGEETLKYIQREGEELKNQSASNAADQKTLWDKLMTTQYKASEHFKKTGLFGWGKGKIVADWASLAGKTYAEIEKLAAQGNLSTEGQKYFEALKAAKEEGADLGQQQIEYLESLRETYTGSTYDSIVSSIVDGFKNSKRTVEDFASTFEDLMSTAVTQSLKLLSEDGIRKWYESFSSLSSDSDGLTAADKAQLKSTWNDLISGISKQAKSLEDITGTSLTSTTATTRQATLKGFAAMSQDTGNDLDGRFTAIQGHTFNIAEGMNILKANSSQMLQHLAGIETNTKRLEAIENSIGSVKAGIDTINLKGITLKQ